MTTKRNLIITGILGIAVILGFVALRGFKVPPEGTEGAIGAANRYQTEQISAKDVKLQDAEIQAFLQSDTFHKLATNPEFRKLVMEKSFQDVARMEAYRTIVMDKSQALSLANRDFATFLVNPATVALVSSEAYAKVALELNVSELLKTPKFYEVMSFALERKSTPVEFSKLVLQSRQELSKSGFVELANKNPEMVLAAFPSALLEGKGVFLNQSGAAELMANRNLGHLLERKAFADVVNLEAHQQLMKTAPEVMALAFQSEAFSRLVVAEQLSALESGFTAREQQ